MDVTLGTILSVGIPLSAAIGGYSVMRYRLGIVEASLAAREKRVENAEAAVVACDAKLEYVRKEHGTRLGQLDKKLENLTGFVNGRVGQTVRALKTAPRGVPITPDGAEGS